MHCTDIYNFYYNKYLSISAPQNATCLPDQNTTECICYWKNDVEVTYNTAYGNCITQGGALFLYDTFSKYTDLDTVYGLSTGR